MEIEDEPRIHTTQKSFAKRKLHPPTSLQRTLPDERMDQVVLYRGPKTRDEEPSISEAVKALCDMMIIWPLMLSVICFTTCVRSCNQPESRQDQ